MQERQEKPRDATSSPVADRRLAPAWGLGRRLLAVAGAVLGTILLVEGGALFSLDRLDTTLARMQQESMVDSRRVVALAESTVDLSLAARRFREVQDREALSDAETRLRAQMRGFAGLARSLPQLGPPLGPAGAAPALAPAVVGASERLEATLERLAATAAEAIDARAEMRVATQDLALIKEELLPDAAEHPTTAIALALASSALSAADRHEVETQQTAYARLLGQPDRPMALTLLVPLFERRLAVLDVEARQRALISQAEATAREIATLGGDYARQLDRENLARQEAMRHLLRIAKIAAGTVGLALLLAAFLALGIFLRGAVADLAGIAAAMRRLAAGDTSAEAPGIRRRDEIGALADAFAVFKARLAERERMQIQLRQAERLEALGRFTGGIAHDFNNLLAAISTNLQLIQESTAAGSPNSQRALRALEAAEGGTAMVQQLLTFGRRRPLEPVPTDIDAVVASLDELVAAGLGEGVVLAVDRSGPRVPPLVALVDPGALENALLNLLFNARDALAGPGHIRLSVAPTPENTIRIRIEDDGAGMPPEVLEHAFEPFFTTKPATQGTGLGLASVYGFVRQSGGHVALRSAVGAGTTVEIDLPRYPAGGEGWSPSLPPEESIQSAPPSSVGGAATREENT